MAHSPQAKSLESLNALLNLFALLDYRLEILYGHIEYQSKEVKLFGFLN